MQPTSAAQHAAYTDRVVPELEEVREEVWAIGLRLARTIRPLYTLSYLLRDSAGGIHLIDPGMDLPDNRRRLAAALRTVGAEPGEVQTIIATHRHPDHTGLVPWLQKRGARFLAHRDEPAMRGLGPITSAGRARAVLREWGVPRATALRFTAAGAVAQPLARLLLTQTEPDILVGEGDLLPIPGFRLRVISTPGHTPGHMVLSDADRDIVFTGDHILPNQFPAIGAALDGARPVSLTDYLDSLRRLPTEQEALPGHGYRFRGLGERVEQTLDHHLRRNREVAAVLAGDPDASVWEIASRLSWTAGWGNLSGFYLLSALRQTAMHRDELLGPAEHGPIE